jgi:hypothetical protein
MACRRDPQPSSLSTRSFVWPTCRGPAQLGEPRRHCYEGHPDRWGAAHGRAPCEEEFPWEGSRCRVVMMFPECKKELGHQSMAMIFILMPCCRCARAAGQSQLTVAQSSAKSYAPQPARYLGIYSKMATWRAYCAVRCLRSTHTPLSQDNCPACCRFSARPARVGRMGLGSCNNRPHACRSIN